VRHATGRGAEFELRRETLTFPPTTHPYIRPACKQHKFGIPISKAQEVVCTCFRVQNPPDSRGRGAYTFGLPESTTFSHSPLTMETRGPIGAAAQAVGHSHFGYVDAGGGPSERLPRGPIAFRDSAGPRPPNIGRRLLLRSAWPANKWQSPNLRPAAFYRWAGRGGC